MPTYGSIDRQSYATYMYSGTRLWTTSETTQCHTAHIPHDM